MMLPPNGVGMAGTTGPVGGTGTAGMMTGVAGTIGMTAPVSGMGALPTSGAAAPVAGMGTSGMGAAGMEAAGTGGAPSNPGGMWTDPGPNPWMLVPEAMVAAECKMDIALLKSTGISQSFAVFRYGKLCYESGRDSPTGVYSVTKTVGGTVTMMAATALGDNAFKDSDLASDWGLNYPSGMQLAHLMSMTAHNRSLGFGSKSFSYDTVGSTGLNSMGTVVNRALMMTPVAGLPNIDAVTDMMFEKLGMTTASWDGSVYGTGSVLSLHDMGKMFTMLIHGGWYNGEQLIHQDLVYRMTHPAFEDANTSYGYFMWLNHRGSAAGIGGDISSGSNTPTGDPCAPPAFWQRYPHMVSGAPDCGATVAGFEDCKLTHDMGVFSAQGLGGQFIVGHPGLDLVLAVKNFSGLNGPMGLWERIRPAVVALDPMFMGDEEGFCEAYGGGEYAPDLKVPLQQPADT
jgi:hypothetical protein